MLENIILRGLQKCMGANGVEVVCRVPNYFTISSAVKVTKNYSQQNDRHYTFGTLNNNPKSKDIGIGVH